MNWYKIAQKKPYQMTPEEFSTYEYPLVKDEEKFPQLFEIKELLRKNNIPVEDIGITGSHAMGVSGDSSDIDIYVKVPDRYYYIVDDLVAPLIEKGIDVLVNWRGTGKPGGILRGTKTHKRLIEKALQEGKL